MITKKAVKYATTMSPALAGLNGEPLSAKILELMLPNYPKVTSKDVEDIRNAYAQLPAQPDDLLGDLSSEEDNRKANARRATGSVGTVAKAMAKPAPKAKTTKPVAKPAPKAKAAVGPMRHIFIALVAGHNNDKIRASVHKAFPEIAEQTIKNSVAWCRSQYNTKKPYALAHVKAIKAGK